MTNTDIPGIITQEQFDEYTKKWLEVVENPDSTELQQSFLTPDGKHLIKSVSFPIKQIALLVSTVGVAYIKARFLIKPDEKADGKLHFSLALFATDFEDKRLSSYYVAEDYHTDTLAPNPPDAPAPTNVHEKEVANVLAQQWLRLWADTSQVVPQLFDIGYGYLRGYNFEASEFMASFFQLNRLGDEKIQLYFGLHEYYRPASDGRDTLVQTVGALLKLAATPAPAAPEGDALVQTFAPLLQLSSTGGQQASQVVYDMGQPSPPNH